MLPSIAILVLFILSISFSSTYASDSWDSLISQALSDQNATTLLDPAIIASFMPTPGAPYSPHTPPGHHQGAIDPSVLIELSRPPSTNWWSLPMQQLCFDHQQCGSGFYCRPPPDGGGSSNAVGPPLPTSFTTCRPCAMACMVCASASLNLDPLDDFACSWCQCGYMPAVSSMDALSMEPSADGNAMGPSDSGMESYRSTDASSSSGGGDGPSRRLKSDRPQRNLQQDIETRGKRRGLQGTNDDDGDSGGGGRGGGRTSWVWCNTTAECMTPGMVYHAPSTPAYATASTGPLIPALRFEAFYPTRLFCSVSTRPDNSDSEDYSPTPRGHCASCLTDCVVDGDSSEGSCWRSCGLPPLSSFPALGLPLNLGDPSLSSSSSGLADGQEGRWPVVAMIEAQSLFASALWGTPYWPSDETASKPEAAAGPSIAQLADGSANSSQFPHVMVRSRWEEVWALAFRDRSLISPKSVSC